VGSPQHADAFGAVAAAGAGPQQDPLEVGRAFREELMADEGDMIGSR